MTTVGSVNGSIQPQQVHKGAAKKAASAAATQSVTKSVSKPLGYIYGNRTDSYMFDKIYKASYVDVTRDHAWVLRYSKPDAIKMSAAKKQEIMQQIWKDFGFKDELPKRVKNFGEFHALINKRLGISNACGARADLINAKYLAELNKHGLISDDAFKIAFNPGVPFGDKAVTGAALAAKKQKCIRVAEGMAKDFDAQNYTSSAFLKKVHTEQVEAAKIVREMNKKRAAEKATQLAVDKAGGSAKPVVNTAANAAEGAGKSAVNAAANAAEGAVKPAAYKPVAYKPVAYKPVAYTATKSVESATKGKGKTIVNAIVNVAKKVFGKLKLRR